MNLKTIFTLYTNGALNIEYNKGDNFAVMGGVRINEEQARQLCEKLGWESYVLTPFEIIDKTKKFIKSIHNHITDEDILLSTVVSFKNAPTKYWYSSRGTCDRIRFQSDKLGFNISVVYNQPDTAKYVIYRTRNSYPFPNGKLRTAKQVGEWINSVRGNYYD